MLCCASLLSEVGRLAVSTMLRLNTESKDLCKLEDACPALKIGALTATASKEQARKEHNR